MLDDIRLTLYQSAVKIYI